MGFKSILFLITMISYSTELLAYELVIIQTLSREKQTFITRLGKDSKIFAGKKSTFTSDNVSIIATAKSVTREFAQWEIDNNYTDVPFKKGEIVTMYDSQEYLWTLNPEESKKRFIKSKIYNPSQSLELGFNMSRGISESTSEASSESTQRGGYQFSTSFVQEINEKYSLAFGFRYAKDTVNISATTIKNTRFVGLLEGRYYFSPLEDLHDSSIYLGLGVGYGQSRTELVGATNSGTTTIVPSTKIGLKIPMTKSYSMAVETGFESVRLDEEDIEGKKQSTNLIHGSAGVLFIKSL